jgi:hypothetical protein
VLDRSHQLWVRLPERKQLQSEAVPQASSRKRTRRARSSGHDGPASAQDKLFAADHVDLDFVGRDTRSVVRLGIRQSRSFEKKETPLASGDGCGSGEPEFGWVGYCQRRAQSPDAAPRPRPWYSPIHVFLAALSTFWARVLHLNANPELGAG